MQIMSRLFKNLDVLAVNLLTHQMHVFLFCFQASPFDSKPAYSSSTAKPSSPEAAASTNPTEENQESEQPRTPVPSEDPEASDNSKIYFLII